MKTISLPNSTIYEFNIDKELVDESLNCLLQKKFEISISVNKPYSSKALLGQEGKKYVPMFYEPLFVEFQKHLDTVSKLHFKNLNLAICDAWLTKAEFGESPEKHNHANSVFSGLLYLTDHTRAETVFYLNDSFHEQWKRIFGHQIKKQDYTFVSRPEKGKLLIWDSDIFHSFKPNTDKHIRYTLAFNAWPTGIISDAETGRLAANLVDVAEQNR